MHLSVISGFYCDTGEINMAKGLNLILCNSFLGLGSVRSSTNLFQPLSLLDTCEWVYLGYTNCSSEIEICSYTQENKSSLDEPHKYISEV